MTTTLTVWQFKEWHLVELNDGREPFTTDEHRPGWERVREIPATPEAVSQISLKNAGDVLRTVETQGYCQLFKNDLQPAWVEKWTKPVIS